MNEISVCKTIGNAFWGYIEENGRYGIDNGEKVFWYNSRRELLIDWKTTLIEQQKTLDDPNYWKNEIEFIENLEK